MASNKRRKNKLVVVFDEKDRREFITGFRKRKNERRKIAKEELKKKDEEKKKQLRAQKRKALQGQIQEYEETLADDIESEGEGEVPLPTSVMHDFGEHTVTVSAITDEDMGKDFLSPIDKAEVRAETHEKSVNENVKSVPTINGKNTRDKLHLKNKFRKKAQKRKIQASTDRKSSKRKPKKKNVSGN